MIYSAYGLNIQSDLPLPELTPGGAAPDLVVRRSGVGLPHGMPAEERRAWADNGTVWLFCRRRGTLRIDHGREVVVDAAPDADERIVRNWVLGQGFAVAMFQRGFLVLHASVVRWGGGGIAFVGGSGAGKSTLAMEFSRGGGSVLADDQAVIVENGTPLVLPGFPQLKLREDALRRLEQTEGPVRRAWVSEEKLGWDIRRHFAACAVPLARIFIVGEGPQIHLASLPVADAALELARHSFLSSLLIKPEAAESHRQRCAALASQVTVQRLDRPRVLEDLPALVRRLQQECELSAAGG